MKEQVIGRLKNLGHVGQIITLIIKIIVIVALVVMIALTILGGIFIPQTEVRLGGTAEASFDLSSIGITEEDLESGTSYIGNMIMDNVDGVDVSYSFNGSDYEPTDVTVEDGIVRVTLEGKDIGVITKQDLVHLLIWVDIYLALFLVSLIFFGRLCKSLHNCVSPFAPEVIDALRNFAFSLIPWIVVSTVLDTMASGLASGNMHFSFSINLGMLVLVILMFVLVRIFRYGAMLQQEADETI